MLLYSKNVGWNVQYYRIVLAVYQRVSQQPNFNYFYFSETLFEITAYINNIYLLSQQYCTFLVRNENSY